MGSWRKAYGRFGAAGLVLVMIAACSSAGPTPPAVPGTDHSGFGPGVVFPWTGPVASGIHVVVPGPSGAAASQPVASGAPRASSGAVTVDQISADYSYKSELITPLAHQPGERLHGTGK